MESNLSQKEWINPVRSALIEVWKSESHRTQQILWSNSLWLFFATALVTNCYNRFHLGGFSNQPIIFLKSVRANKKSEPIRIQGQFENPPEEAGFKTHRN